MLVALLLVFHLTSSFWRSRLLFTSVVNTDILLPRNEKQKKIIYKLPCPKMIMFGLFVLFNFGFFFVNFFLLFFFAVDDVVIIMAFVQVALCCFLYFFFIFCYCYWPFFNKKKFVLIHDEKKNIRLLN